MGKTRRFLTGGGMLLTALLLQVLMLCPLVTVTVLSRQQTLSWFTLHDIVDGIHAVIGGVEFAQSGAFWITAAVVLLESGIVVLAVCGVWTCVSPSHPAGVFAACGGGTVFAVSATAAYILYDTLHAFPFRFHLSSVDMEMTVWVMPAVSAIGAVIGMWGARCFKTKERAT